MSTLTPARKTLENEFWDGLCEVARHKNLSASALIATIAKNKNSDNLSSAIRVFVVDHFRTTNCTAGFARTVAPPFLARRPVAKC